MLLSHSVVFNSHPMKCSTRKLGFPVLPSPDMGFLCSEHSPQGSCHLSLFVIIDDGIRYFPSMRFTTTWGAFSDTPFGWWGHCGSLHPWWDFSGKLESRRFPNGTWCGLFVQGLYSPSHWPCLIGGGISGEGKGWARCAEQEVAGR